MIIVGHPRCQVIEGSEIEYPSAVARCEQRMEPGFHSPWWPAWAMTPPAASVDSWVHTLRSESPAADWPSAVSVLVGDRCRDCGLCDPGVRIYRCGVSDGHHGHDGRFPRGSPAVHGGRVLHDRADPRGCGNRAVHVRGPPRSAHRGAPTPAAGEAADGAADRPDDWSFHHLRMGPRWS